MPKFVDYPRGSLKVLSEIATAVKDLGGSCSLETCADYLNKKVSGSFKSQVSSAIKYNFINTQKGMLSTTPHFKKLSLAYDDEEKTGLLRESFFNIPVFKSIYERFVNGKLPVNTLDKILIREFDVPERIAGRIANYFSGAAREANLLNADNSFVSLNGIDDDTEVSSENENNNKDIILKNSDKFVIKDKNKNNFLIKISGPGIHFEKEIKSEDDFIIVNAIIQNIQKQLVKKSETE